MYKAVSKNKSPFPIDNCVNTLLDYLYYILYINIIQSMLLLYIYVYDDLQQITNHSHNRQYRTRTSRSTWY